MLVAAATVAVEVVVASLITLLLVAGGGPVADGAAVGDAVTVLVLTSIVAALLAVPLAYGLARTVAGPVDRLAARAERGTLSGTGWSTGDGPTEIGRLAAAMRGLVTAAVDRSETAEAQRDRFGTLLREMGDAVLVVTKDDRVDLANPAAERLLGQAGVVGRRLAEVARDHELLTAVERARHDAASAEQIERTDPRRSIRIVARLLPGGDVLVAAQDLTTLRRLETVRSDFVANVSHELRTPIASIKAMVETLESGALNDASAAPDFLARIHREVDDLAQLVTELLSLARIESGAEALDLRDTDPGELVRGAADRMRALAERAGVDLSVSASPRLPAIGVDREKIATVLTNLVHNAVKFTPAGGSVVLAATRTNGDVCLTVRDTGAGIDRDDLERIFERFYKSDTARSQEGTGLGLAIAKHIVLAHGGRIRAESEGPGRGATFRLTLPVARAT